MYSNRAFYLNFYSPVYSLSTESALPAQFCWACCFQWQAQPWSHICHNIKDQGTRYLPHFFSELHQSYLKAEVHMSYPKAKHIYTWRHSEKSARQCASVLISLNLIHIFCEIFLMHVIFQRKVPDYWQVLFAAAVIYVTQWPCDVLSYGELIKSTNFSSFLPSRTVALSDFYRIGIC